MFLIFVKLGAELANGGLVGQKNLERFIWKIRSFRRVIVKKKKSVFTPLYFVSFCHVMN